jgi:hypothetical protein
VQIAIAPVRPAANKTFVAARIGGPLWASLARLGVSVFADTLCFAAQALAFIDDEGKQPPT